MEKKVVQLQREEEKYINVTIKVNVVDKTGRILAKMKICKTTQIHLI
jgi:hypothetical protein